MQSYRSTYVLHSVRRGKHDGNAALYLGNVLRGSRSAVAPKRSGRSLSLSPSILASSPPSPSERSLGTMEEPRSPVLSKPNSCSRMPLFYTEDLLQKGQFDNPKTLSGLAWEDPFNLTNWCTLPECEYHNEDSAVSPCSLGLSKARCLHSLC